MSKANYQSAADVLATWRDDVLSGTPPTFYLIGSGELARDRGFIIEWFSVDIRFTPHNE